MGKHKEWRRLAKKTRRKRIRCKLAREREEHQRLELEKLQQDPSYQTWLAEQEAAEEFEAKEEKRISEEQNQAWLERERIAQAVWEDRQRRIAAINEEKAKQILLLKEKLLEEEKKIKEEKEKLEQAKEEAFLKREKIAAAISEFISGQCKELPPELCQTTETAPGRDHCPFYSKVGACRFSNQCSRNHIKPGVSNTLMIPGFYSHFSLYHHEEEVDSEIYLEFEDSEFNKYFMEFYEDVVPELGSGLKRILVCRNGSPHLRGNVYVEYDSVREAVAAFARLNGRYYAGKQLSVEFVVVSTWRSAVCGQQWWGKCHKGSQCNFLHVFKHPQRTLHGKSIYQKSQRSVREPPDSLREEQSVSSRSTDGRRSKETYSKSRHSRQSPHKSRHSSNRSHSSYHHSISKRSDKHHRRKKYSSSSSSSPSPPRKIVKKSKACSEKNGWDSDSDSFVCTDNLTSYSKNS